MGRKLKKQQTYTTAETFPIHKSKSLSTNLNNFIKQLKARRATFTTKQYVSQIHKLIAKYKKNGGSVGQDTIVKTTKKFKICKQCDQWTMGNQKTMRQCYKCEDYYHMKCADSLKKQDGKWFCPACYDTLNLSVDDGSEGSNKKQKKVEICHKCTQNKNQKFVKCLKCSHLFHKSCYGGSYVVCDQCNNQIETKIKKMRQLTLNQSFKLAQIQSEKKKQRIRESKRLSELTNRTTLTVGDTVSLKQKSQRQVKQQQKQYKNQKQQSKKQLISQSTNATVLYSNSRRFTAKFPILTSQQIAHYKQNLVFAILSKNMSYNENLECHNCSLFEDNQDSLDFAIEHLSNSDLKMFREYKKQPIGPFILQYKEKCGYDVVADRDLDKGMIVCEYVGDVYTMRGYIQLKQNNDSVMELKKGKNADESLMIAPRENTNIARFINGINCKNPASAAKKNVQTVRVLVQGRPAVVLYTTRRIKKGESLHYDYGAGQAASSYDTSYYQ